MSVGTSGAILIGAGVAAAGGVGGSLIGSSAAGDAADKQLSANDKAIAAQERMNAASIAAQQQGADKAAGLYREQAGIARQDLEPFRQAQLSALGQLQGLSDPSNPLYQQQREQSTRQIQRQLAAQGLLRSKNQTDLLTNLELGLNQERTGILGGIAGNGAAQGISSLSQGLGQQLGGVYGGLGQNIGSSFQQLGQQLGQANMQAGQINAQRGIQQAGLINSAIGGVGNAFNGAFGQIGSLAQLKTLLGGVGGGGGGSLSSQIGSYQIPF